MDKEAKVLWAGNWSNWTGEWRWEPPKEGFEDGFSVEELESLLERARRLPRLPAKREEGT